MGDPRTVEWSYTHNRCGESTTLSGVHLLMLCDPFSSTVGTYCSGCEDHFPLKQFTWDDTGERISEARRRNAAAASFWVRLMLGGPGWLAVFVLGAALGFGGGFAIGRLVKSFSWPLGIVGGLLGFFAGAMALGALIPVLLRGCYGVSDWRELE